ncbi:TRAP transporter small permease [Aliamphritea ceti]|uniref:TRAP transporter small permease n=1 Tax=Aliamphritea ceti TaxID=1524258 RepID=UPI0021C3465B|nr:TRAP transporter small permease [Aliamphritea ceti]
MRRLTPLFKLRNLPKLITRFLERLLGLIVIAAVIINLANIIGRYVFGSAVIGAEEALIYLMIGIVFAGTILVTLRNQHMSMSMFVDMAPVCIQKFLRRFEWLVIAVLAGFVAWVAFTVSLQLKSFGQTSLTAGIPMWLPHGVVALGFGLSACITGWFCVRGVSDESDKGENQ